MSIIICSGRVSHPAQGLRRDPRGVPHLGPPLPHTDAAAETRNGLPAIDAEQQRVDQESEAARTSKVFAVTAAHPFGASR